MASGSRQSAPSRSPGLWNLARAAPALDCYLWLAYRLHALHQDRLVTWTALKAQFGVAFKEMFHFKPRFVQTLALATAVYPGARVEIAEQGVILKPSRAPGRPADCREPVSLAGLHSRLRPRWIPQPPAASLDSTLNI
jgi:hypothetical protein